MQAQVIQTEMPSGATVICYNCAYVGLDATASSCPHCSFPLIVETRKTPAPTVGIGGIFDRTSVHIGAPPLPGVDAGKRKAQLLAEARKRRATRQRTQEKVMETRRARRRAKAKSVALASAAAAALGAVVSLIVFI